MRKSLILIMVIAIGMISLVGFECFAEDVVKVGAVQPITGRFAFAGVQINAGLEDALMMANEDGGINGKKIEYIMEDGTYSVDKAVAAFKRIMARDNPLIMYGESTGMGKAVAPEVKDRYKVLYSSTSFSSELANAAANPYVFVPGPTYSDMFDILLKYIAKENPVPTWLFSTVTPNSAEIRFPMAAKHAKNWGSTWWPRKWPRWAVWMWLPRYWI